MNKTIGILTHVDAGYDRCHNEEVIARINYNKDADREYTSTSVFCTKGHSYIVALDKAESM